MSILSSLLSQDLQKGGLAGLAIACMKQIAHIWRLKWKLILLHWPLSAFPPPLPKEY